MHSRDVSAIDTRPPRCCSWLHSCFAKYFTQTALAAAAPAGGNRGDAEWRQRTRAAPSPRPRPLTAAVGFTAIPSAPGMRWLPWCRSQTPGWGCRPDGFVQDPHHRVTHRCRATAVRHRASSPAQLLVEPRGGTSPTSPRRFPTSWQSKSIVPSLPVTGVCVRSVCQAPVPGSFAPPAPQIPGDRLEGEDLASCHAEAQRRGQI